MSFQRTGRTLILGAGLFLILILSMTSANAAVGSGECKNYSSTQDTACYGIKVGSTAGYGAVELCNDCFPCGFSDGVCPEQFGAQCFRCPDPDCTATVYGYVRDQTTLAGINEAEVAISPGPHITTSTLVKSTTNSTNGRNGFYRITSAPRGIYNIRAAKAPYAVQYEPINVPAGGLYHNITLGVSPCNADCSRASGNGQLYCDASCQGVGDCAFPTYTHPNGTVYDARTYCANTFYPRTPGEIVYVTKYNATHHINVNCCDGTFDRVRTLRANILTCAKDIYRTEDVGTMVDTNGNIKRSFVKAYYYFYTTGTC